MADAKWPSTLEEAVDMLLARLSDEDEARLAAMPEEDLPSLHFSFGMGIRNDFGLWGENTALLTARDCLV